MFHSTANFVVLCRENKKEKVKNLKTVCSVLVTRLEFISVVIADQL